MRAVTLLVLLGLALPLGAAPGPLPKRAKRDRADLRGEWVLTRRDGDDPARYWKAITLTLTAELATFRTEYPNGDVIEGARLYKIDERSSPKAIDLPGVDSPDEVLRGIIRLDGDTLTLCLPYHHDTPRPTEFAIKRWVHLWVYKRDRR